MKKLFYFILREHEDFVNVIGDAGASSRGELIIWMLLIIMLYPVLVMGFKDLLAGLLGFMSWPEKP